MILKSQQKIVFIGDSITDCGRTRPQGEGCDAIGNGYVRFVDAILGAIYPELQTRIINKGNSGNTVLDLRKRWDEDVVQVRPDWLCVMIDINDVWRQFDSPRQSENHVTHDVYDKTLRELVSSTRNMLSGGLILMSPFMIESNAHDKMRARMDEYGTIVKTIATENNAIFVDVQAAFNRVLEVQHSAALAWDRIHPNHIGHMTIARAWLDAVGFAWK